MLSYILAHYRPHRKRYNSWFSAEGILFFCLRDTSLRNRKRRCDEPNLSWRKGGGVKLALNLSGVGEQVQRWKIFFSFRPAGSCSFVHPDIVPTQVGLGRQCRTLDLLSAESWLLQWTRSRLLEQLLLRLFVNWIATEKKERNTHTHTHTHTHTK